MFVRGLVGRRVRRRGGAGRGDVGLVTLEWILIIGAAAALAGVVFWVVWSKVEDGAADIAGSDHFPGAVLAAAHITADARAALPVLTDPVGVDAVNEYYGGECRRLRIAYLDIELRSRWVDADSALGDRFDVFDGVADPPPRALCLVGTLGQEPVVPLEDGVVLGPRISVDDVTGAEGDVVHFTVSLSAVSTRTVAVDYATFSHSPRLGIAREGLDYQPRQGSLTFAPGVLERTVSVALRVDGASEGAETFELRLVDPRWASFGDDQGTGTIEDAPAQALRISGASSEEGGTLAFEVNLGGEMAQRNVSVRFDTVAGTPGEGAASSPGDYVSRSGTLTIFRGQSSAMVRVVTLDDLLDEAVEGFEVRLRDPVNAVIAVGEAVGTISDNDDPPQLSVFGDEALESEGPLLFELRLSAPSGRTVTALVSTADGTAIAPGDYTAVPGASVSIDPGATSVRVPVILENDDISEMPPLESLTLSLSNVENARLGAATAQGTIIDDDSGPTVLVDDAEPVIEGETAIFTVRLSEASTSAVTVAFNTVDGTAIEPDDYAERTGSVTFGAGETSTTVEVTTEDDTTRQELDETFELQLTSVLTGNATIGDPTATGWIIDNDIIPEITVDDTSALEHESAIFTVRLSRETSHEVMVNWASALHPTATHRATAPLDFALVSGQVTFTPGETVARVTVPLVDDVLDEYNELFRLRLGGAVGGTITDGTAVGTIVDNDPEPTIEVLPAEAIEGEPLDFEVRLDAISGRTVTANFATDDSTGGATAIEGEDYARAAGTVTIRSGARSVTVPVLSLDDQLPEESETFVFRLSHTTNAVIGGGTTLGTIHDNDLLPNLSVGDLYVVEGDDPAAVFVVELDRPAIADVTFDYATVTGSARPGADCDDPTDDTDDYLPVTGNATILAGETQTTISVTICDDTVVEEDEDFILRLSNATEALIVDEVGATATILDNDGPPRVAIGDAEAVEADGAITFPVTLSHHSATDVLLDYATFDGTATQPDDYIATGDRLRIPAGDTEATITVLLTDDVFVEDPPVETFTLRLTAANADDAEIIDGEAIGTIYDDDVPPTVFVYDEQANENDGTVTIRVDLSHPSDQEILVPYRTEDWTVADYSLQESVHYEGVNGTLVFPPGALASTFDVTLIDNGDFLPPNRYGHVVYEASFWVILDDQPVDYCSGDWLEISECARVLIRDDERPPRVGFVHPIVANKLESAATLDFGIYLLGYVFAQDVTAIYQTEPHSSPTSLPHATAGDDYVPIDSGTVTILAGALSATIQIPIIDDDEVESTEFLQVRLTGVDSGNATIRTGVIPISRGGITDDDTPPELSVDAAEAAEDTGVVTFWARLNRESSEVVRATYTTADITGDDAAQQDVDYLRSSGTLVIPAGDTRVNVNVSLVDDDHIEGDERFMLNLSSPENATLEGVGTAEGTILDDDDDPALPVLFVSDVAAPEDDIFFQSGSLRFTLSLSEPNTQPVEFTYGIAEVPSLGEYAATRTLDFRDYYNRPIGPGLNAGTMVIPATTDLDPPSRVVSVYVVGDNLPERDERLLLWLADPVNVELNATQAWGTIVNNDLPIVSIENVEVSESDPSAIFTVVLHEPSLDPTSVRYRTRVWPYGGTSEATPGEDFTDVDGILTFAAGQTTATITVPIRDDTVDEYNESFVLQLYDPVDLEFANESAVATIADDEPGWWIDDAAGSEDSGTVSFLVRRDPPADAAFTLQYEVADGGATGGDDCADPGVDYLTPSGSVSFAPGITDATIAVTVCDDATVEGNETFLVTLLDVTGRRTTATGTIAFSD